MISFIVPAHNEERVIGPTLASIHAAAREAARPYEIIVADDSSTDGTGTLARREGARVVSVRCRQIAAARNAGARAALGDIFIFIDADTTVSAQTLGASLRALEQGAAGGGATFVLEGRIPLHGRVLARLVRASMRAGRLAAGCYLFCRRDAFEGAGGFDERLFATEEIALSQALKRSGPVVILAETVETSGRKLRTHSVWDLLRLLSAFLSSGGQALRSRTHLDLWYGSRRVDPDARL
jgi:cellulose synthase/poly-beta-1,6-N-acetylglucosamine synthase-like glycosyltransferase